jgi:hypothetical protein
MRGSQSHLAEAWPDLMASNHRVLVMPAGPEENSPDPRLMNPNGQYEVVHSNPIQLQNDWRFPPGGIVRQNPVYRQQSCAYKCRC